MHSYDNGHSLQRKLDNWAQLNKFFKKKGFVIDRELINDVVHPALRPKVRAASRKKIPPISQLTKSYLKAAEVRGDFEF